MISKQENLPKRVHIIGICGVATSALAIALHQEGVKVTGSDKGFFPPVSTELEKHQIPFYAGWHPEKIDESGRSDVVIAGASGTSLSNPEIIYAKGQNIPLISFAEALGKYVIHENSVVASGTWGKTTSSALLSYILTQAGMDPGYFSGGISLSHPACAITNSKWSVVEGDEYQAAIWDKRPKFFYYQPTHLLLTAVSWDHADLYPTEKSYFETFGKLVSSIPKAGLIVANIDDSGVKKILKDYRGKAVFYGKAADYTYETVFQSKTGLDFTVQHGGESFKLHSPMIGAFQAENITGCFAMAHSIGIAPAVITKAVSEFEGLKRRLEKRSAGDENPLGVTVFDDIAHSPEKARAVLKNLREIYDGQIIAVFEPNSGGRSRESKTKYDNAFKDANLVIIPRLTKLKVADDKSRPMEGDELARVISQTHSNAKYIEDDRKLVALIISSARRGDAIVFLGSHGFRGMIEETLISLRQR